LSLLPAAAKQALRPIWNRGHRLIWWAGRYADAVRGRRIETCFVCGRLAPILYYRGIIPPRLEQLWELTPRLAEALAKKESCMCGWCGAKLRARRLAQALVETIPAGGRPARSVAEWARRPQARTLRIAEINRIEGLHQALRALPAFTFSDFSSHAAPGSLVAGVRSEDLMRLSYPDDTFDVILTSETLEHVPDLAIALGEIHRVLVPGGWHLFTVPLLPDIPTTFARAVVTADGALDHRAPPIRHPGGDTGYLVYTEFGADLTAHLARAGFSVHVAFGPVSEDDIAQVFVTQRV
jgi:hypothetical protein